MKIKPAELMLQPDGSIYHLGLKPEELADTVICVGNPERVELISRYFDDIEVKRQHREFVTHTGYLQKKRLSVISTGIGTDNIDIFINELDALANIDFKERTVKPKLKPLNIIRVGTSGGLHPDIPVDALVASRYAIGMEILLQFYKAKLSWEEEQATEAFIQTFADIPLPVKPYVVKACEKLYSHLKPGCYEGITFTASGFFVPQGRLLRAQPSFPDLISHLHKFSFRNERILNMEMEASAIYGLGKILNHHCCTVAVVLNNRVSGKVSKNAARSVQHLIEAVLPKIIAIPDTLTTYEHSKCSIPNKYQMHLKEPALTSQSPTDD